MTRSFQRGLQSWALFRGGDVSTKGFHEPEGLSQELSVPEAPAPTPTPAPAPTPAPNPAVQGPILG
jgi:hypothetical protein